MKMLAKPYQVVAVLLCTVVLFTAGDNDHGHGKHHDPVDEDHFGEDGEHNAEYDHKAVLGDQEDEFDNLPPEEAKRRLGKLVDKMDKNGDGNVDMEELTSWILHSFRSLDEEEGGKRLDEHDDDKDGKISWQEYIKHIYDYNIDELKDLENDTSEDAQRIQKSLSFDEKKFAAADQDGDKLLSKQEYAAFLHPYDYDHMTDVEVETTMIEQDKDKDNTISFEEFTGTEKLNDEQMIVEKEQFSEYDQNKDGVLDKVEVRKWVAPDNIDTATKEAEHLMEETDDNHDKLLSKAEIVDHHELWVGSQATDYGEHLKDEL